MILPQAYFALQLQFAEHVAPLAGLAREDAILEYTTFYLNFELDRSFDPAHPVWQAYLRGLREASDPAEWTYAYYRTREQPFVAHFYGCFHYSYWADIEAIRLHFINRDPEGPLGKERMPERFAELRAMFTDIRRAVPEARFVRGGSWLYNVEAYRRLFPPEYPASAVEVEPEYNF